MIVISCQTVINHALKRSRTTRVRVPYQKISQRSDRESCTLNAKLIPSTIPDELAEFSLINQEKLCSTKINDSKVFAEQATKPISLT